MLSTALGPQRGEWALFDAKDLTMTHDHGHGPHDHNLGDSHDHSHEHDGAPLTPALDVSVADGDLSPAELGRRTFLRATGLLGAGAATASVLGSAEPAAAAGRSNRPPRGGYRWLAR